ncbi:MAG: formylmethanofuran dehydrogenase subunit E family protein [Chloroflexi bacterium]|nr:formylmethanofuran dehydrogenase subunit E family protein [Chloroflexota bacterium]
METDGCGADGVAVAADCHVGRRTLRVVDYGKMAATFVDVQTEESDSGGPQRPISGDGVCLCARRPPAAGRLSGSVPGDAR